MVLSQYLCQGRYFRINCYFWLMYLEILLSLFHEQSQMFENIEHLNTHWIRTHFYFELCTKITLKHMVIDQHVKENFNINNLELKIKVNEERYLVVSWSRKSSQCVWLSEFGKLWWRCSSVPWRVSTQIFICTMVKAVSDE